MTQASAQRTQPSRAKVAPHARALGWAGLLPFLALAIVIAAGGAPAVGAASWLAHYAFGILCFLLGSWWGIGLMRAEPAPLLYSNALFIVLFASRALLGGSAFMLVAALLFLVLLVVERRQPVFSRQPAYYATLRTRLSLVAASCLLTSAWLHP